MVKKCEVEEFLGHLRNPQTLIAGCRRYHETEPRDIAYVVSRDIIMRKPFDKNFILAGAKMIIITWNAVRFQRLPRKVKDGLEKDILTAYGKCKQDLIKLNGRNLSELSLHKEGDLIRRIFSIFSSKPSLEYTGASKVLHIINPEIFMMWDASIRDTYHKLHKDKNHKIEDCYLEFLKQSQEIINCILTTSNEDKLWQHHLDFMDRNFIDAFSIKETILKMLDECNFMKFKRKESF